MIIFIQPLKLVHVSTPRAPLFELSARTRKRRVHELQMTWSILSAGAEDADMLFEDELRCLSEERKEKILHDAFHQSKDLLLSPCLVSLGID